ncbi:MAG: penicillin-binding protein activator [Alphaproteobacteria bacterium]|nr:penicillin-binding protein activator [Alphaproteobacteria bacterium]NNF24524.1 penicillin-binding protein activator [Paracoccaceae bacterium]
MFAFFAAARNLHGQVLALVSVLFVAACDPSGMNLPSMGLSGAVPVALLVPTSAANGGPELSQSFENAARLAMADLEGVQIDLRVYDTGGEPALAAQAAERAIDDGARIILGPLFAENANAVGVVAAGRNTNVLTFSNNPAIAGGNVYLLGSTFQNTADRLVRHAAQSGRSDILVVHGNSPAEISGRDAIARAIAANGARYAANSSFDLNGEAVIAAIPMIAEEVVASGADTIFFTSGTDGALPFLAELLPENGVDPAEVQFIGLQRLDVPASALSLKGLQGAIFAVPDPGLTNLFRGRYEAAFGTSPHPLAALAYDGIAAIGVLASPEGGGFSAAALTRPSGFAGANGVFRLSQNGTNERGLAVARIENNQVVFVEPAPRSFGTAGF